VKFKRTPDRVLLNPVIQKARRERVREQRQLLEQADVDHAIADITTKTGKAAFEEAYNKGRTMTMDEAVTFALDTKRE